jgi:protein involved in polysaccharide export with SLBB domain/capsular polysaccharide biosynthesis protein
MKDNTNPNATPSRVRAEETRGTFISAQDSARKRTSAQGSGPAPSKMNAWLVLDILLRRWHWMLFGAMVFGAAFFMLGWSFIHEKFTATAQLRRYEVHTSENFKMPQMSSETFAAIIRAPDLLKQVSEQASVPISPERLAKSVKTDPEPDSDMVKVTLVAATQQQAVDLINLYCTNVVVYTTELQARQARQIAQDYLKSQVDQMNSDISVLDDQFRKKGGYSPKVSDKIAEIGGNLKQLSNNLAAPQRPSGIIQKEQEKLQEQMAALDDLLSKYTDLHPEVIRKKADVARLQENIARASTNTASGTQALSAVVIPPAPAPATGPDPETDIIRMRYMALQEGLMQLTTRQREALLFATKPPGMVEIFAPATLKGSQANFREVKIGAVTVFGAVLGIGFSLLLISLVELTGKKLRTHEDVERVTKLPVITGLGNLERMGEQERSQWAFRTWTALQGRLSPSANHGLVCGITSSTEGEGRSTWIRMMAEAASHAGFRVLTIATKPSSAQEEGAQAAGAAGEQPLPQPEEQGAGQPDSSEDTFGDPAASGTGSATGVPANPSLTSNALTSPSKVTEQLTGPNSQPMVHIPLPGWVWNLDRRKQWREALEHWRSIDNLVILVELPPASVPEAVLLGSNLPNLVWLTDSGLADAAETRAQLETLRDARCNLVGAVVNREPGVSLKKRFPRWVDCVALFALLGLGVTRGAEVSPIVPTLANPVAVSDGISAEGAPQARAAQPEGTAPGSFSIVHPSQKAAWQQHLTLGPGDVLTMSMYGMPEMTRTELAVGPDGHISYLQADVLASGLSIDELRAKCDEELGKFYRNPRTMVTPIAFRSKRYYMLGKVMTKGVFVLDRPITVLEAIARAHGLENGLVDRNVIDLADFQRSFLMRGGKRISLNFEKLFQDGDLTQNIAIEPGDYIYFPSTSVKEVYVVGEVRLPGTVLHRPDLTIMGALAARGGYTDRAYKAKVVVVRGSLNHPEMFAVDTHAILVGKGMDFQLQPKDIIFVNSRPFIKVEELADLAATAFIQSLVTSWVGADVVKPFK